MGESGDHMLNKTVTERQVLGVLFDSLIFPSNRAGVEDNELPFKSYKSSIS